jgi:hypothetical protein
MANRKNEPPHLTSRKHDPDPLCDCERNINAVFDILFEEVLKSERDALDPGAQNDTDEAHTT